MSDVLRLRNELGRHGRLLSPKMPLKSVQVIPNTRSVWHMEGFTGNATCLGCHDAPCIEFKKQSFNLGGVLGKFPGYPSQDVCPTNAINWRTGGETVEIDEKLCIGCGLCALQCPYGAITLNEDGKAKVEIDDPDRVTVWNKSGTTHTPATKHGTLSSLNGSFIRDLPKIISKLNDAQTTRLVRNIFLSCGISANIRRKGDTNVRMDGLLKFTAQQIGVLEIETSDDVLESPRALLEDIAVLNNRFGIPLAKILPVSLIVSFPNKRSEYYRVIYDIEKVLDFKCRELSHDLSGHPTPLNDFKVRCRTLTLGALFIIGWHFKSFENMSDDLFTTKPSGSVNLLPSLQKIVPELSNTEPYLGSFVPPK